MSTRASSAKRGREGRSEIEQDDAVLGRYGDAIDDSVVVHQPIGAAGQVSRRAAERDLLGRIADVNQGNVVLEVPDVRKRRSSGAAIDRRQPLRPLALRA